MDDASAPVRLADDLWLLDTRYLDEPQVIASYLLTGPEGLGLVDVGSGASVEHLLDAVRATGHDPQDITHLLLTHVHLDHAGAAGILTRRLPRARAYVHSIGAPHLIDPSKLLMSAQRIYGDQMRRLWGETEPVPAERVVRLEEGDVVRMGGRALRVLYTPGHAVHHVAFCDDERQVVFPGDVAGVALPGMTYVRPPTPPPDLDLELWSASIERLEQLAPREVYLPHFGAVRDVRRHLADLRARLWRWGEVLLPGIRDDLPEEQLVAQLATFANDELARSAPEAGAVAVERYELATNYRMSVQGYIRYFRKLHPERLA